jgi:hypothetical protein
VKTYGDARKVTGGQLEGLTPPEVDELFSAAWDERYRWTELMFGAWDDLHYSVGDRRVSRRSWRMSHTDAYDAALRLTGEKRASLDRLNQIKGSIAELDDAVLAKLNAEFDRRGGWPRAYLVTDGHVHSSMHCSSCNNGMFPTRFSWMIDYSGKTHAEIIEAAGERACTVCYPDAPVARRDKDATVTVPKSVMFTPEEIERARLRDEEAARRTEKKAKAALGAITQPDGTPLRDEMDRNGNQRGDLVKTLRTARSELKRQCRYQYMWGDEDGTYGRNVQHLARAVAWKENGLAIGVEPTADQVQAVIEPLHKAAVKEADRDRARR